MSGLYVPLNPIAMDALRILARRDRRRPQEQAAVILEGLLLRDDREGKEIGGSEDDVRIRKGASLET
jgi:hypothetical protein